MKRIVLSIIASAFFTCAYAQEAKNNATRYYKHEVNVGIGGVRVRSGWSDDYERSVMDRFGLVVQNLHLDSESIAKEETNE